MTTKNTRQLWVILDKISGLNLFKTVPGVSLKIENEPLVFENGPCKGHELKGDLLLMLTNPKYDKINSVTACFLHNVINEIKFNDFRRDKKSRDRTVHQNYLRNGFLLYRKGSILRF